MRAHLEAVCDNREPEGPVPEHVPWKMYVANHARSETIVGPGLVSFSICRLHGTHDENRDGQARVDFIAQQSPGGVFVHLHPGSEVGNDAAPFITRIPPDCWQSPELVLKELPSVPAELSHGMGRAWTQLEALAASDEFPAAAEVWFDATTNDIFFWWLWFASLHNLKEDFHTRGVTEVSVQRLEVLPHFSFQVRAICLDGWGCTLTLHRDVHFEVSLGLPQIHIP